MKRLILALIFMSAFVALNAEAKLTKVRWVGGGTAKPKIECSTMAMIGLS